MSWCPKLRAEVRAEDGFLIDPVLDRRLPLGAISAALVVRLDGALALESLLSEVSAACQVPLPEVEGALRTLLLLHQIEGSGEDVLRRAQDDAAPRPRTLPRARFGCRASGQCCRVYRPGPLGVEDLARLEALAPALSEAYPTLPSQAEWIETRPGDDGHPADYLRRIEGRCLFLQPDHRCGVHALAGFDAKPEACRAFPFDAIRTLDGLRIHDVSQCSSFATTSREGPPHADYVAEMVDLAPAQPRLHHPLVQLSPGVACDYGPVLALEARLLELCDRPDRVAACGALARAFAQALAASPLGPGEPEATVRAVLETDEAGATAPLASSDPLTRAKTVHACATALEEVVAGDDEAEAPLAEAFLETLAGWRGFAAAQADLIKGPLPQVLRQARALPFEAELAESVLAASQRNRVFGGQLLLRGHLEAGVLRLALHEQLSLVGARMRAAARGAERVEEEDLSAGHWTTALSLARPAVTQALLGLERHAWALAADSPSI